MKRRAFPFFFLFGIFLAGGSSVASEVDAHEYRNERLYDSRIFKRQIHAAAHGRKQALSLT
jgi:hypothetical protein